MPTAKAPNFGDYKGNPVIHIYTGRQYQGEDEKVTLGLTKARAILDNIDWLRKFVDCYDNPGEKLRKWLK